MLPSFQILPGTAQQPGSRTTTASRVKFHYDMCVRLALMSPVTNPTIPHNSKRSSVTAAKGRAAMSMTMSTMRQEVLPWHNNDAAAEPPHPRRR